MPNWLWKTRTQATPKKDAKKQMPQGLLEQISSHHLVLVKLTPARSTAKPHSNAPWSCRHRPTNLTPTTCNQLYTESRQGSFGRFFTWHKVALRPWHKNQEYAHAICCDMLRNVNKTKQTGRNGWLHDQRRKIKIILYNFISRKQLERLT